MIAVLNIDGRQLKVEKGQEFYVDRMTGKEGDKVTFDNIVLLQDGSKINIGTPLINGAIVNASIIEHLKGDKVIVFKKKRRKGYKVKNGHRQMLTKIKIESISQSNKQSDSKEEPAKKTTTTAKKTTTTAKKTTTTAKKKNNNS
jgi:large subunit ribosomal protein L21